VSEQYLLHTPIFFGYGSMAVGSGFFVCLFVLFSLNYLKLILMKLLGMLLF
jgi:hypothetical protein